jgi:2-keto-3-deoxy-galactonokinase
VNLLPLVLTSGWASGVNAYAVVAVMGLVGRIAGLDEVPAAVQQPAVIAIAAAMFAVEFVADKVPYVDSLWDGVSTLVRPTVGAVLGYLIAGDSTTVNTSAYAVAGGGSALASHLVKAGLRLAVNASPEPFTNIAVSSAEDVTVVAVVSLALYHPWLALGIASLLFLTGAVLVVVLFRLVLRGLRRSRRRSAYA